MLVFRGVDFKGNLGGVPNSLGRTKHLDQLDLEFLFSKSMGKARGILPEMLMLPAWFKAFLCESWMIVKSVMPLGLVKHIQFQALPIIGNAFPSFSILKVPTPQLNPHMQSCTTSLGDQKCLPNTFSLRCIERLLYLILL